MLRKLALTVTALALLVAASSARAQETDRKKFGLGIGANASTSATPGAYPYELYFPIRLSPAVRIEPSFGLLTVNRDGGGDSSDVLLGIGVFALRRMSAPVDLYYGGRLKLDFASGDVAGSHESSTDFYLAAAAGGEYFVVPSFSLGLEGNLGYYTLGKVSGDLSGLYSTGLFFLRLYL